MLSIIMKNIYICWSIECTPKLQFIQMYEITKITYVY
jgi:hypothetical protein